MTVLQKKTFLNLTLRSVANHINIELTILAIRYTAMRYLTNTILGFYMGFSGGC